MKRFAVLIAAAVLLSSSLSGQSTSTPLFSFHSNPWLSLHHFIRAVARQDLTNVMYIVNAGLYDRMCGGCGNKVASAWGPYLDGKRSMNDAFTALVLAFK